MITEYRVTGMTCNHCVHAIKSEVAEVPGVTAVDLNLADAKLQVHSEAPIDFDRLVEAVYEAGENYSIA